MNFGHILQIYTCNLLNISNVTNNSNNYIHNISTYIQEYPQRMRLKRRPETLYYDDFKGNSVFYLEYNLFMAYQTIKKKRNKLQGIILKGNSHPLGETLYMCLGVCLYQRPNPWSPMYGFWTDRIKIFAPKKYSLLKI